MTALQNRQRPSFARRAWTLVIGCAALGVVAWAASEIAGRRGADGAAQAFRVAASVLLLIEVVLVIPAIVASLSATVRERLALAFGIRRDERE